MTGVRGLLRVIVLHATHHWVRTLLLAAAVSVAAALPITGRIVVHRFEHRLHARAHTVPLLIGAAGSRFDLVFTALHFRLSTRGTIPLGEVDRIAGGHSAAQADAGPTLAIPLHVRFTARGEPIAAVGFEYFGLRGLTARQGRLPAEMGEVVLGARTHERLGLVVGDELPSDQRTSLDITAPSSIMLRVVGVLEPTGGPDDDAVFADLSTAWLLEGLAHGHEDAQTITDPASVFGRTDDAVSLSAAVPTYQRITDDNSRSFHLHADRAELPITAVLVYPTSSKAETILAARYNADRSMQAVRPARVVDELVSFIVRLRTVFDAIALVLAVTTASLLALIAGLSVRIRSDELRTLREIGVARHTVVAVAVGELGVVAAIAAVLVGVEVLALVALATGWLPVG